MLQTEANRGKKDTLELANKYSEKKSCRINIQRRKGVISNIEKARVKTKH